MSLAAAAATILLSVADPRGDTSGDGSYLLPSSVNAQAVDLRAFTARDVDGHLQLTLSFGAVDDAVPAPNGFSSRQFAVFIGSGRGGELELGDTGFRAPPERGWSYEFVVNGWSARLERAPGAPEVSGSTVVRAEGTDVVLTTPIPAGQYRYWAMVGLYDSLTSDGWRRPSAAIAADALVTNLPSPPPVVDVLAPEGQARAYATRELEPAGEEDRHAQWLLLAGLVGVLVALAATIWGFFRR